MAAMLASLKKNGIYLLYGVVNCILSVPSLYGYAAVIFGAHQFQFASANLAKLVVLSSAVHQVCFSVWSSLPFAIGQVQDAGLIFLSKIATHVADSVEKRGGSRADVVSTSLFALATATATLGLALLTFGKARLTFCVSYLPMPVLGGYLAYIGLFCCEAGLGLCVGDVITGPSTWHRLWQPRSRLFLALPGALGGLLLMQVGRRYGSSNDAALPIAMVALLAAFYGTVFFIPNYTLADARHDGWLAEENSGQSTGFLDSISLYSKGEIYWLCAARGVLSSWVGMTLVVAFSSCLDVAAIEVDLGKALDMDSELATVGKSNVISGLCGGFTGSYIFSQTIFTLRTGCRSRLVGWCVVVAELAVVASPTDLSAKLPLFFFAATLAFVGIDLLTEWLIEARDKYGSILEYASSLFTFFSIQVFGLDTGLIVGLVASCGVFLVSASQLAENKQALTRVAPISTNLSHRQANDVRSLERIKSQLVVLELRGQLWWGTSASMLGRIKGALKVEDQFSSKSSSQSPTSLNHAAAPTAKNRPFLPPQRTQSLRGRALTESTSLLSATAARSAAVLASRDAWLLVLDLHRVDGIDASAVRSLFLPLYQLARAGKFKMAIAALTPSQQRLFGHHGIVEDHDQVQTVVKFFPTVTEAVEWAQDRQLDALGGTNSEDSTSSTRSAPSSLEMTTKPVPIEPQDYEDAKDDTLPYMRSASVPDRGQGGSARRNAGVSQFLEDDCLSLAAARYVARSVLRVQNRNETLAVTTLRRFCTRERRVETGMQIFQAGDDASTFFLVLTGSVILTCAALDLETGRPTFRGSSDNTLQTVRPGSFFGYVDGFASAEPSNHVRSITAVARGRTSFVVFNFSDMDAIFQHSPEIMVALQRALIHQGARELINT